MKSGVIPILTVLTVLHPFTQGLECYFCVSNNHPNPGSDPKTPAAHDNCEEGHDLPDNIIQACTEHNSNDILNIRATKEGWKGDFACTNHTVTTELTEITKTSINNGTHGYARVRGCTLERSAKRPVKLEAHCVGDPWKIGPNHYFARINCYCYEDKCNASIGKKETVENVTKVVSVGSHGVVGIAPKAIISTAVAVLFLFSA